MNWDDFLPAFPGIIQWLKSFYEPCFHTHTLIRPTNRRAGKGETIFSTRSIGGQWYISAVLVGLIFPS